MMMSLLLSQGSVNSAKRLSLSTRNLMLGSVQLEGNCVCVQLEGRLCLCAARGRLCLRAARGMNVSVCS